MKIPKHKNKKDVISQSNDALYKDVRNKLIVDVSKKKTSIYINIDLPQEVVDRVVADFDVEGWKVTYKDNTFTMKGML